MADLKISELTNLTAADPANDMIPIVDVSATPPASGSTKRISINNILACSPTATLASATISGDLTVDTNVLKVDTTNNWVGIGTATPAAALDVQGSSLRLQVQSSSNGAYATWKYIGKNSTGTAVNFEQGLNIAADNAFELYDNQNTQLVSRYVSGVSGAHSWFLSGTTAMTLNSTGLGVGASPTNKLTIGTGAYAAGTLSGTSSLYSTVAQGLVVLADGLFVGTRTGGDRFTLDTSGNVGIGVTPSAWSGTKALQIGSGSAVSDVAGDFHATANAYNTTTGWVYISNAAATDYYQRLGAHVWRTAGAATGAIAWTQAMTLESTGSLVLGAAAVATTATDGFLYIPGCAGTPTGTPTAKTGRVPLVVDTTNNKLYFYSGGAWVAAN